MGEIAEIPQINEIFEPLSLEIKIKNKNIERKTADIYIGNSGLLFQIREDGCFHMNFAPDLNVGKPITPEEQQKFSKVFIGGFYEFYQWWLNKENFTDIVRPNLVVGLTVERMHKFREHLFNSERNIIYETTNHLYRDYKYKLDLEKLKDSPEKINLLKTYWNRCQRGDIKMKPINF